MVGWFCGVDLDLCLSLKQIKCIFRFLASFSCLILFFHIQEIQALEEELKVKDELIQRQEKLLQGWRELLTNQRAVHLTELERV
jgi:hypothetical protein